MNFLCPRSGVEFRINAGKSPKARAEGGLGDVVIESAKLADLEWRVEGHLDVIF
jgi:hypothetical protein